MAKKVNGLARWILVVLALLGIMWNAFTLHYGVKENTAVLQNEIMHLTDDVADIKQDIKAINTYLLERRNQ